MKFEAFSLSPKILQAIKKQGYETPSPVQQKAIPAILQGKDVLAAAQTGTGKTAAFTLPVLQLIHKKPPVGPNAVRVLVLTPTRELAAQVQENIEKYSEFLQLRSTVIFGGVKINPQMMRLRRGMDILVATPGRLLDLIGQNAVKFDQLEMFILDEADRMLDMGFINDIRKIIKKLPEQRQNLMFSATFSPEIRTLAKKIVNNPVEITISSNSAAKTVHQLMHPCDKRRKALVLRHLIEEGKWEQVLVFARTKRGADKVAVFLEKNDITAAVIHGDKSQGARTRALREFKEGAVRVLVATDIAARGIDIDQLPQVVNYDLPQVAEDYVHRIGRTGRAGAEGYAYSLVSADEADLLFEIERLIQKHIKREYIQEFVPVHEVPASKPIKPPKKHRPKNRKELRDGVATDAKPASKSSAPKGKRPFNAKSDRQDSEFKGAGRGPRKARTSKLGEKRSTPRNQQGKPSAPAGKPKTKRPAAANRTYKK